MICRTEGLVLRTYRMTESSLVAVLFTRHAGKLRAAARGARRPKSRFGASLQPVTRGHYVYSCRPGRELQTLAEGDILDAFDAVKRDYIRLAFASAVCEMLDHVTIEEDRNAMLYSIALDTLSWLGRIAPGALELPYWYFQLKAAGALGCRPHLSGCVETGRPLSGERAWFSPELGGTCLRQSPGAGLWLPMETVAFLEAVQAGRAGRIDEAAFARVPAAPVRRALRLFLAHHLESGRARKAAAFLERLLDREAPGSPAGSAPMAAEGRVRYGSREEG